MRKYRIILILLGLMVLINISVAVTSYMMFQKVSTLNAYTQVLAREQAYIDKISKDIIDVDAFMGRLQNKSDGITDIYKLRKAIYNQQNDIRDYYNELESDIELFQKGGSVTDKRGRIVKITPQQTGDIGELNKRIDEVWTPLSNLVTSMIKSWRPDSINDDGDIKELHDNMHFSADYVRLYSEILTKYIGRMQEHYNVQLDSYKTFINRMHMSAMIFTVIFFLLLVFWALRSLIKNDREVEKARQETQNIMRTVKEGLFLIDEDLTIGSQHSVELENILGQKSIAGQHFTDLLANIISEQDFNDTKEFINLLFKTDTIEKLITDLNPLTNIKVMLKMPNGEMVERYLSFAFSRVYESKSQEQQGKVAFVLVSVSDITRQILLEERLEKERTQHDEHLELLSTILSTPSVTFKSFIRHAKEACIKINDILRQSSKNSADLVIKANQIFREVHSMKGEASSLGLHRFVSIAEGMESQIADLKRRPDLSGKDFLSLTVELDKTIGIIQEIENIYDKVYGSNPQGVANVEASAKERVEAEEKQLAKLVQGVADRNGKQVEFSLVGWENTASLPEDKQDKLKEVIIQLLRNAVVHGIETQAVRESRHKKPMGHLQCTATSNGETLSISVVDDGNGINFDKLYEKASSAGEIDASDSPEVIRKKLLNYLFASGVSTAETQGEDAGRGVGMDVVKSRLHEINGTISLKTLKEKSTTFKLNIPLK